MSDLNSKSKAVSVLLFAVTSAIGSAIPLSRITIMLIALSAVLSAVAYFLSATKNIRWTMFAWVWSALCLPYILVQVLLLDYLTQYVTVETLVTWGPAVYVAMLPIALAIMLKHLRLVIAELY